MSDQSEISNVTLVSDDASAAHTFNYKLNKERARKKLYEGANREAFKREDKKECINLIFNDGAFKEVILNSIIEIRNGPKHFIVGKENVERISIDRRDELTGRHVDTKIEFRVNGEKVLIHVYNSTQKLTIQGKRYRW